MASVTLHVSNLAFSTTEETLRGLFDGYGDVRSINMPTDRETGRPRGFAFVEMADKVGAEGAADGLNQTEIDGRAVRVAVARPRR